ncbi:isoaspartyl peptidase/L-asparaginase family protein [Rubrivirga sp. IMCC43871]|uniref:isoaspartyl peptidase/L-asparaginase family protein n=1 Tax=Rubrivirga sp. IMCC43871 TaxID=3391575 RepID=UPI00398FD9E2
MLIHGGAWDIPDNGLTEHLDGLERALRVARRAFERGQSALDVAVETVAALEDHSAFDAGRGAVLDRDGLPQLDAGVMDGADLRWGAVANVRRVKNPVRLAHALLAADGQARLLVAEGAERFAAEIGLPSVSPESLIVDRERERYDRLVSSPGFHTSAAFAGEMDVPRGTVGCVVCDAAGRLAAATSTGGAPLTRSGRVGDSPIPGAGFYADARGAASTTGWGEAILTTQLASRAVGGRPEATAAAALADMAARVVWPGARIATGGVIALDAAGAGGWAFTTPRMARGWWRPGRGTTIAVER